MHEYEEDFQVFLIIYKNVIRSFNFEGDLSEVQIWGEMCRNFCNGELMDARIVIGECFLEG